MLELCNRMIRGFGFFHRHFDLWVDILRGENYSNDSHYKERNQPFKCWFI